MNGFERAILRPSQFFSRLTNKELFKHNFIFFTDNMYFLRRQSIERKISYKKVLTYLQRKTINLGDIAKIKNL